MKRILTAVAAAGLLAGCGLIGGNDKPKTPTIGTRIPVLSADSGIEVDPALAPIPVSLPPATANEAWAQSGGTADKSMGHLALGGSIARAWTARIGEGGNKRARLASPPVIAAGRVYTIDTFANVRAFDARNGGLVWQTGLQPAVRGQESSLFGGGVAFANGRVYATNGTGQAAALDAASGKIIWRVTPGGPLRGQPTVDDTNVYVISQDNQLYALNPATGETRWTEAGTVELAGVFGTAAPAASQGTVVAGFSSGELTAYRYENGRVVWQDALARTSISTSVSALSDIDADPVIDSGRVYAVGQGGRMVALELNTGQRIWEINVAGISTPWVAGDWIFVVTDQAQLLAIARATGRVKWVRQLRRWRDAEDKEGPVSWVGPVLAGNRLILANSIGEIAYVSPETGTMQASINTESPVSLSPVVAGNTLYLLHDNGQLSAWR